VAPSFSIRTRDPGSRARTGTLALAHGEVRTPAFVPLATKAVVKTLEVSEAGRLGYDMVLSNTFHLFLAPGPELVERFGGVHGFMRWDKPVITDSGGFQVFSMGHGTVADEIKGRSTATQRSDRAGAILAIDEEGVRFRSYVDGSEKFLGPETSMAVQAALGSDIALVFDECLPFHVTREYTARSTERTHRWLDRCLRWHEQHGDGDQAVYGIVQGGVEEDLRRWSAQQVASRPTFGLAIGGTLGKDKPQMYEVVGWTTEELPEHRPRHLLGIGDVDDLLRGVELGIDTFDCAMPTRIGRHGMAIVPDPERRWRVDLAKGRNREADEPICAGCPCVACAAGYSRAYLHYLFRLGETTGARIVTLHNLAYLQMLMAGLRDAIDAGRLAEAVAAARAGAPPWAMLSAPGVAPGAV
jgi:queuine tRNA-ribosyltransferase